MNRTLRTFGRLVCVASVLACSGAPDTPTVDFAAEVAEIADLAWRQALEDSPYLQMRTGLRVTEFPDITPEKFAEDLTFAREMMARIDAVPRDQVSHEEALTLDILRWSYQSLVDSEPYYWHNFQVTPYIGGFALNIGHQVLANHPFLVPEVDTASYLTLLGEYADWLEQSVERLGAQAEKGIRLYRAALPGTMALFEGYAGIVGRIVTPAPDRVSTLHPAEREEFLRAVAAVLTERIEPGYDRILALLTSPEYQQAAPAEVGLAQLPEGEDYYRFLVRLYTTMDLSAEELHELGQREVERLERQMAAIRREVGWTGTKEEFRQHLRTDPRFLAGSPEEVADLFMEYIHRIEPEIESYFSRLPVAPYGVQRLDPANEAGMTFGYYQPPTPDEPTGLYRFNGSQLDQRSMVWAGPLIYHELIPGHHLQIATQSENHDLPVYRREVATAGAYSEGWGNYSAQLAEEMGMLRDPYERYGWAIMDMFTAVRLVVDTGMNLMGWTLEEGREYMRQHLFQSETEILTESLRYSTDMPGQGLGYKAGLVRLLELRERARELAGEEFDIRDFHEAVLGSGAMPLSILDDHIEWYFSERPAVAR